MSSDLDTDLFALICLILLVSGLIILAIRDQITQREFEPLPLSHEINLNWDVEETIEYSYEECKNINKSKYINRLFKKDYRLSMCPRTYVVLYDESQHLVFKFNENEYENPAILSISTSNLISNITN